MRENKIHVYTLHCGTVGRRNIFNAKISWSTVRVLSSLGCWAEQDHTESLWHTSPLPGHQGTVSVRLSINSTWTDCILMPSLHQFPPRALLLCHQGSTIASNCSGARVVKVSLQNWLDRPLIVFDPPITTVTYMNGSVRRISLFRRLSVPKAKRILSQLNQVHNCLFHM